MKHVVVLAVFTACFAIGGSAVAEEEFAGGKGIFRFDFGQPDSPVLPGFTQATHLSKYSPQQGFGWITTLKPADEAGWSTYTEPVIVSRTRKFPDDAARDHVYGFSGYNVAKKIPATFQVDAPNGDYLIRISVGDSGCGRPNNPFHIDVNGKRVATDVAPGSDTPMDFTGTVTDGKLRISFKANAEESERRCKRGRWSQVVFTLWTCDYVMIYPAAKRDVFGKDLETFRRITVANMTERFVPKGRMQKFEVRDGCIVRDGKPMFFNHRHEWGYTQGEFLDWLQYFGFGNAVMSNRGTAKARGGVKFLTADWKKGGRFPGELFSQATSAYEKGMLCTAYGGVYTFLPGILRNDPDYVGCIDNRGKKRNYPNYNDPLYREYVRQVYVNLGKWTRQHPGFIASYPYEEMYYRVWDGTILSYDEISVRKYRTFLKDKYGTIARLNAAWQRTYGAFGEIDPPRRKEQSPNFADFQRHRAKSLVQGYCKPAYEALDAADPYHLVIGEKPNGQYFYSNYSLCSNGFNYTPWCDIAKGEGGLERNQAEIDWWGLPRASMNMALPKCAFQDLPESSLDPWTKQVPGADDYVDMMGKLFKGMKSLYTESYDAGGGAYHLIHPTKQYRERPPRTPVGRKELKFKKIPLADYVIEPQALGVARAHQFAYRTAPILMPARVRRSEVAHVCTEMTSLFGYSMKHGSNYGIQGDYRAVHRLFDHLHRPMDVVTEYGFADAIKGRKVLVAGLHGTVASKEMVKELRAFLKRGGVVILSGEAFRYDTDTLHSGDDSPIAGLSNVLRADMSKVRGFASTSPLVVADAKVTLGLKKGDVLLSGKKDYMTMPVRTGCIVIATVNDKPVVVASPDGHMLYIGVRLLGTYYRSQAPNEANLRKLIEAFVKRSGSVPPADVPHVPDDAFDQFHLIRTSVLEGNGYYLVEISNTSTKNHRPLVNFNFIDKEPYDVLHITGESPIVVKNAKNEFHLRRGPLDIMSNVMPLKQLHGQVGPMVWARQSYIMMLQPSHKAVWQLLPDYTVRSICRLPVAIVLPDAPADYEKTAAEEIRKLLTAWGTDVKIVAASDVKTKRESKTITFKGYPLETFAGKRFDVDRNLIVIGEAARNALVKKLYADDTFTMDKVILRTSDKVPGPGKGVIQLVESVNSLVYDWTDKSCDAIVITGSNAPGVQKALERFQMILWQ